MSKKTKRRKKSDDGGDSNWLVSYADMMTLICCFFILMMAFANYDPVGFQKKVKQVSKHFNKDKYKSSETKMKILQEEISKHPTLKKVTKISVNDNELVVSFSGTTLFQESDYRLSSNTRLSLDALIDIIKTKNNNFRIVIEGHTSNIPVKKDAIRDSKWALSSARAATVADRFEYFGFKMDNIVPIGYGSTRPVLPNQDKFGFDIKENIILNNRVVLKVVESLDPDKAVKLGLGVYFEK